MEAAPIRRTEGHFPGGGGRTLHRRSWVAPSPERALALVHGYKRDLDLNRRALRATRRELVRRGHDLTEVRILDLLIWSARPRAEGSVCKT